MSQVVFGQERFTQERDSSPLNLWYRCNGFLHLLTCLVDEARNSIAGEQKITIITIIKSVS